MLDSLYSGISGLDSFQKTLNTEANNISNINTVAYKSDTVSFADLMYQDGYGKGTSIVNINKDFTQGEIKITNNAYDMAIEGRGFFTVQDTLKDDTYFTRAGNFGMGVDGFLQTPSGEKVMGVTIDAPTVISTNESTSQFGNSHTSFLATQNISSTNILQTVNAKATNYNETAVSSGISGDGYKSSAAKVRDVEILATAYRSALSTYNLDTVDGVVSTTQSSTVTFPVANIADYGDEISLYINGVKYTEGFDGDSISSLNKMSDKISNLEGLVSSVDSTGLLTITSLVPGKDVAVTGAQIKNGETKSDITITTEAAQKGSGLANVEVIRDALKKAVEDAGAEFLELTSNVNLDNQTNLNLSTLQLKLDGLDISDNSFGDFSVDDGALYMKQGDNKFLVGKVVTSIFENKVGLDPKGNNLFGTTKDSGEPIYAAGVNEVSNNAVELSNADFSVGLVNMMTYQRAFEGSSKTINTSDEILKTTLGLKK